MMGLRLSEGIARSALIEETGRDAPALYGRDVLRRLEDLGLLELDAERLRTSPAGRPLLNSLTGELLANR
jgi:coproporphyrinogen III oxidase-like Fe-S oxidoreductase